MTTSATLMREVRALYLRGETDTPELERGIERALRLEQAEREAARPPVLDRMDLVPAIAAQSTVRAVGHRNGLAVVFEFANWQTAGGPAPDSPEMHATWAKRLSDELDRVEAGEAKPTLPCPRCGDYRTGAYGVCATCSRPNATRGCGRCRPSPEPSSTPGWRCYQCRIDLGIAPGWPALIGA